MLTLSWTLTNHLLYEINTPLQASCKVVIDTDAGVDDAVALFLAIAAHKDQSNNFEILGITTVSGNTGVDYVCRNVGIVLESAGIEV